MNALIRKLGLERILHIARAVSGCLPEAVFCVDMEPAGSAQPSLDERLFCVTQDLPAVELDFIVESGGATGSLQVADFRTGEFLWEKGVNGSLVFTQAIGPLKRGREYALRFTGTGSARTRITVSYRGDELKALASPLPAREPGRLVRA